MYGLRSAFWFFWIIIMPYDTFIQVCLFMLWYHCASHKEHHFALWHLSTCHIMASMISVTLQGIPNKSSPKPFLPDFLPSPNLSYSRTIISTGVLGTYGLHLSYNNKLQKYEESITSVRRMVVSQAAQAMRRVANY